MFNFLKRKPSVATISPDELQHRLAQGERLTLVDVREPAEYAEAHLKGSHLIPLDQLAYRLGDIPKDRPVVAVCRSGNRSGVAADLLQRAGYPHVLNLEGGLLDWTRRGLPVQRGR